MTKLQPGKEVQVQVISVPSASVSNGTGIQATTDLSLPTRLIDEMTQHSPSPIG